MKKILARIIKFINEPSITSFGDNVYRPRWISVLCDYAHILTMGLYKPRAKIGKECFSEKIAVLK